ncbi:MAG: transglycosylase SLT domain-containing protein [Bacteroidota bacterium]
MKFPWTHLMVIGLFLCLFTLKTANARNQVKYDKQQLLLTTSSAFATKVTSISEQNMRERLRYMSSPISVRYNDDVRESIRAYVVLAQRESKKLLGLSSLYFPIFEHYLKLKHLPEQLKYLPIIESRLRPSATSHVGAAGLWQFMKATGRQYGLRIDDVVDERRDPIRATEAAVEFLEQLYLKYRDWTLVLAAYNCGPARLSRAIRQAGSRDYWKVRQFLPKETQDYIPRFIAASYLVQYHTAHDLHPTFPSHAMQHTRTIKLYDAINFEAVANLTGLSAQTIARLNPSYRQAFVPSTTQGQYMVLPAREMAAFQQVIQPGVQYASVGTTRRTHLVQAGDTIESLARIYSCSTNEIVAWNGMEESELFFRQALVIYVDSYDSTLRG